MHHSHIKHDEWVWRYGTDMKTPFADWKTQREAQREANRQTPEYQAWQAQKAEAAKAATAQRKAKQAELEKQGKWRKPMSLAEALAELERKLKQ